MAFVDREIDYVMQAQTQVAEQLTRLAVMMIERLHKVQQQGQTLGIEEQQMVNQLIIYHCMDTLEHHGLRGYKGRVEFESERYSYELDGLTQMLVYHVYDWKTDRKCFSFQRYSKPGKVGYIDVTNQLTNDQEKDFVWAIARRSTQAKEPSVVISDRAAVDSSPIESIKAQLETLGNLAPRGSKAAVVADALLQNTDHFDGTHYTAQRKQDGGLSIYRTGSNEQILNMAVDSSITQSMNIADANHFDTMFSTLKDIEFHQSQLKSLTSKSMSGRTRFKNGKANLSIG